MTGRAAPEGDVNGDGYADLVSGAPGTTVSHKAQAGCVAVTYGSAKGLVPSHKKLVSRSTSGVPGSAAAKQRFGETFSKGDLDGDGYSDLVIGAGEASSGAVWSLRGSGDGLTTQGATAFGPATSEAPPPRRSSAPSCAEATPPGGGRPRPAGPQVPRVRCGQSSSRLFSSAANNWAGSKPIPAKWPHEFQGQDAVQTRPEDEGATQRRGRGRVSAVPLPVLIEVRVQCRCGGVR